VKREQYASREDEQERENDVNAEGLDLRQSDDERELEHVHQHVDGVLHSADDSAIPLHYALLHRLRHHEVRHPQT